MQILSLDASGSSCGVVLWQDGQVLAEATENMDRGQDQRLMPLVMKVMTEAQISFKDIDRFAVTRGPGSFTGLRIGLAAARGLGLAAGKPVIGIDRFAIYREQVHEPGRNLLVVIGSKRLELYCQYFPWQKPASAHLMMTPAEIEVFLGKENLASLAGDTSISGLPATTSLRENEAVTCALLASRADPTDPAFLPRPLYIRPPDVTLKGGQHHESGTVTAEDAAGQIEISTGTPP